MLWVRRLVNAYGRHLNSLEDSDTFDALRAWAEIAGLMAIGFVLLIAIVFAAVSIASAQQSHGSCKIQHWAVKYYVCDEYYPLPTERP